MSQFLQSIALVFVFIFATGLSWAEEFNNQQLDFAGRLYTEAISTDPDQWDDATRREFFGNMPTEYHQRYLELYAKLREAKKVYWKTRAELYKVIHPLYAEHIADFRKEVDNSRRNFNATNKTDMSFDETYTYYREYEKVFNADYDTLVEEYIRGSDKLYLAAHWNDFRQYPGLFDPDKQAEFWKTFAEDILFLYETTIESFYSEAENHKQQTAEFGKRINEMTLKDLPDQLRGTVLAFQHHWFPPLTLNDTLKGRILNDEPLFLGILGEWHNFGYARRFPLPHFSAREFLKEARDAEREPWKIDATPELTKLAVNQAEINRWDGSLSLHPFIRAIAERCKGINMAPLETTFAHASMGPWGFRQEEGKTLSNTHPAIMALIRGEKDTVFSTRQLSKAEIDEAKRNGIELVMVPFAKDAFVFLQNRHNPVRNLTMEQYQGIFSGKYQHWKDVGGFGGDNSDAEKDDARKNVVRYGGRYGGDNDSGRIRALVRNEDSGSEELMQTMVMRDIPVRDDFKPARFDSMAIIFERIEESPGGIAYSIYHYDRYMVFNASTRVMAVDGVLPNADSIASGKYPLVYEAVLIHRKNPGTKVERLVKWLLSDEGQRLVRSIGYVPIRKL